MYIQYELKKILRCVYPIALYTLIQQLLIILTGQQLFSENAVAVTTLGALITIPISIYLRHGDIQKHHVAVFKHHVSLVKYLAIPVAASTLSIGLSFLTALITDSLHHTDYQQVADTLFSEQIFIQYLGIGIIVPIAEEMIFRGLIQNRIRTYLGSGTKALLITGVVFGLFHDSIVQAAAAAVSGIIIGYIYEKYGRMLAPILFHICFNMTSVIMQHMNIQIPTYGHMILITAICLILTCLDIYIIRTGLSKKDAR